jgi:hypothetical protein
MKNTFELSIFAIFVSLAFTNALLAKEKDDAEESTDEVRVEKLVLVRKDGDKYNAVKQFKPDEKLNVLVFVNELKEGTTVKVVWTIVDAGGEKEKKMYEDTATINADVVKNAKAKDNRVDFSLSHKDPLSTGDYKVEAYLNGELAKTVEFTIEE